MTTIFWFGVALLGHLPQTFINEVGVCQDDPDFDCAKVSAVYDICRDIHHSKMTCRKYCGLCGLVDGSWSDWSPWSSCDVTCSSGHVKRTRTCTDPAPAHGGLDCVGDAAETSTCLIGVCPDGGWSTWSEWDKCSASCLGGLQKRQRKCDNPKPTLLGHVCVGYSEEYQSCKNIK